MIPGFYGLVKKDLKGESIDYRNFSDILAKENLFSNNNCNYFENEKLVCFRKINKKFLNDKIFDGTKEIFIIIDGVILNSKYLISRYCVKSLFDAIQIMYKKNGHKFVNEIKGDFSGLIYDKNNSMLEIFTNHVGSKPLFYYYNKENDDFIFGSSVKIIYEMMKKKKYKSTFSEKAAYYLLTFGYMLEDETLINEIKKLEPGSLLNYNFVDNRIEKIQYYKLDNSPNNFSKEKYSNDFNEIFDYAITLEYNKDCEYNYNHLSELSGGLDSRMNVLAAYKQGFRNITCTTVSNKNYLDEKIARKITKDLNLNFIFDDLRNGDYLKNINENIRYNEGRALFSGAAATLDYLKKIQFGKYGLIHTGMIGDAIAGNTLDCLDTFVNKQNIKSKAYSKFLFNKLTWIDYKELKNKYNNIELFNFYNRAFNGAFNGYFPIEQFTEFSSPFLYIDLLEYALKIPRSYRKNHKFYIEWIYKYNRKSVKYKWETINSRINQNDDIMFFKREKRKIELEICKKINSNKYSMEPISNYYRTNRVLKNKWDKYLTNNISYFYLINKELAEDMVKMYKNVDARSKSQVLTVIAAYKYIFGI